MSRRLGAVKVAAERPGRSWNAWRRRRGARREDQLGCGSPAASEPVVWYLCKYVSLPDAGTVGGRGYALMTELARRGNRVVVITSDSNHLARSPMLSGLSERRDSGDVTTIWLRTLKYRDPGSLRRILSWFHFEWRIFRFDERTLPRPDAVIASSLSLLTVANGYRLKRKYGARLVLEIRDIWPLTLTEQGGVSRWHPLALFLRLVERVGYRVADVVVGTMPNLEAHVRATTRRRVPVRTIPQGFDPSAYVEPIEPSRDPRFEALDEYDFVVGYAGSVGFNNAMETFFEAAAEMQADRHTAFVVVGDGALLDEYRQRYGTLANVFLLGAVPKSEVQGVLRRFDVVYFGTHPSAVWDFGQSLNKLVDYMLSGRPVIGSFSGYPSMVTEADSGVFVPAADVDALVREIRRFRSMSPDDRSAMGQRGAAWVREHRSFAQLAADYERILFDGDRRDRVPD